jgi:hypothetical protein
MGSLVGDNYNSTTTPLAGGATFTGQWRSVNGYTSAVAALLTDASGMLYMEQSPDGVNADSSLSFKILSGANEVHRITITRAFFRIRIVNDSAAQSFLRAQVSYGDYAQISSPLNASVGQDADAIISKSIDPELSISAGLFSGISIVNKFGRNPDVDPGSTPEDLWNGGGVYTGFPTGGPEEFEVFSSSASDTGVLTFTYLASSTSTAYQQATVTLNGTTPVATGITGYRMHTARYSSGSSTGFNVGTITLRHRTTTANVFCVMPIGRSQTNVSSYTVPAGSTAYIKRIFCRVIGSTTGTADGSIWIRTNGGSPRLRRPFTVVNGDHFEEEPYGGLAAEEKSDIAMRISVASTNNLDIIGGYDLILVKN